MPQLLPALPTLAQVGTALTTAAPYIAAAGTLYAANQNIALGNQQAEISAYQQANEAIALTSRIDERKRRLRRTVGAQRALYSSSGVALEGTPTDIFADTAREFAYEDYADRFNTYGRMQTASMESDAYRSAGRQKAFGNLLDFGISWGMRG